MQRLEVKPRSLLSSRFNARVAPRVEVELKVSLRERCVFRLDGERYEFRAKGLIHRKFDLIQRDTVIATAKVSNLRRAFDIEYRGYRLTLKAKSMFRRAFLLLRDEDVIGTVTPTSLLGHGAVAEFPDMLTTPAQLFVVWLVLVMWKREVAAAGAS